MRSSAGRPFVAAAVSAWCLATLACLYVHFNVMHPDETARTLLLVSPVQQGAQYVPLSIAAATAAVPDLSIITPHSYRMTDAPAVSVLTSWWNDERLSLANATCSYLQKYNSCEIVPAFKGSDIPSAYVHRLEKGQIIKDVLHSKFITSRKMRVQFERRLGMNTVALALGHLRILTRAFEAKRNRTLILEDDVLLTNNKLLRKFLLGLINTGWEEYDMLNLSDCSYLGCNLYSKPTILPVRGKFTFTQATMYNLKALDAIHESLPMDRAIDLFYRMLHKKGILKIGCVCPSIFIDTNMKSERL